MPDRVDFNNYSIGSISYFPVITSTSKSFEIASEFPVRMYRGDPNDASISREMREVVLFEIFMMG